MEGNKRVRRRRRNTVERLKNLLILLLTLSAVVLTVRVLMFNGLVDKGPRGWLDHLLSLLDPGQSVPADTPRRPDSPEPPPSPCVLLSAMGWTALRFSMTQPKPTACSVR